VDFTQVFSPHAVTQKQARNLCSLPNKAAQIFAALQIRKTGRFMFPRNHPCFMGGYVLRGGFLFMLHLRSVLIGLPGFRKASGVALAKRSAVPVAEFAFPLAKRDYDCFNKDQRVPINGARLGRILSRSQVCSPGADARRVCLV
jgi:hypothetical protein